MFEGTRDELTQKIIGCCIDVHKELGPGLLESTYEECLCYELNSRGIIFSRQVSLPVIYKNSKLDCNYRLDVLIKDKLIIELKSVEKLQRIHEAQLMTYLKLSKIKKGLLINFNVPYLKDGIKRMVI